MSMLKKIRVQLPVIVVLCYLLPASLLGFYMGGVMIRDEQAKTEAALLTQVEYSQLLADQNVSRVVTLARAATYDGELDAAVAQRDSGAISEGEFLRVARNYIERKYSREAAITFAATFTLDNPDLLLINRSGYAAAERYQSADHAAVRAMSDALDTQCRFVVLEGGVYLVRNLLNRRMKPYGMLVLGLDVDRLMQPMAEVARQWDARLDIRLDGVDFANLTKNEASAFEIFDWDGARHGEITRLSGGWYACAWQNDSRDCDLRVALLLERRQLYGETDAFRRLLAGLLFLLAPILGIITWYAHRRISRPIALLSDASRRIESGELGVTVPMRGDDELGSLGKAFSNMSLRIEELIDKTYKEEIALRDAQIQAMQSRINPHFINNALENINWQARIEGSESISAMVESLSVLLNAGMSRNNRRIVTLKEEMEVARAYFYFVGLSYGERLRTRIEVAEDALTAMVPVLTLQPLIENAVEHGIAPAGGGEIQLRCTQLGPCLRLEVINSGRPITPEDRRRIDAALAGDSSEGAHLGLANICTRLNLIYRGQASASVSSDAAGLTHVTLDIPQGINT